MRSAAAAIVLAGGSGARVGAEHNKVYLRLGGRTVLGWSLRAFTTHPAIGPVVLVTRPEDAEQAEREVADLPSIEVVTGGATRQDSEWCGLYRLAERITTGAIDTVLIHDGARPLVSAEMISDVLAAARTDGGAVPGLLRDDLAVVAPAAATGLGGCGARIGDPAIPDDTPTAPGGVPATPGGAAVTPDAPALVGDAPAGAPAPGGTALRWPPDADGLVAVQTPQGFRAGPLLAAYDQARADGFVGTDTASCVQRYTDLPVRWVPGDERNLKITYPHDLDRAARLVSSVTR